jgi:hypothetical protein
MSFFPVLSRLLLLRLFFETREKEKKVQTDKDIYIKSLVREREKAQKSKGEKASLLFSLSLSLSPCLTPAGGTRQLAKEQ